MRVQPECISCYMRQTLLALKQAGVKKTRQSEILYRILPMLPELSSERSPAENSSLIIHRVVELLGGEDPYLMAKEVSNRRAKEHLPAMTCIIAASSDPLYTAFKVAVAGNVVDLGLYEDYNLEMALQEALRGDFAIDDYQGLRERLMEASSVLVIGDNSGEIVFDRLLLEQLSRFGVELFYGVKGGFILNDATEKDAREAGIHDWARVVTNGNRFLGTVWERCSPSFQRLLEKVSLIISKGQANYETLEGTPIAGNKTFFVLKAKCQMVAEQLGVPCGSLVLAQNQVNIYSERNIVKNSET